MDLPNGISTWLTENKSIRAAVPDVMKTMIPSDGDILVYTNDGRLYDTTQWYLARRRESVDEDMETVVAICCRKSDS